MQLRIPYDAIGTKTDVCEMLHVLTGVVRTCYLSSSPEHSCQIIPID
jgi:hypothetical protein